MDFMSDEKKFTELVQALLIYVPVYTGGIPSFSSFKFIDLKFPYLLNKEGGYM